MDGISAIFAVSIDRKCTMTLSECIDFLEISKIKVAFLVELMGLYTQLTDRTVVEKKDITTRRDHCSCRIDHANDPRIRTEIVRSKYPL